MLRAKTQHALTAILLLVAPTAWALDDCAQDSKKHSTFDSPRPWRRTHVHNQTATPLEVRWRSRVVVHNPDSTTTSLSKIDLDNTYDLSGECGRISTAAEGRHQPAIERLPSEWDESDVGKSRTQADTAVAGRVCFRELETMEATSRKSDHAFGWSNDDRYTSRASVTVKKQ